MFGTNLIRRASKLFVPPLIGLAVHPLGRFQPCPAGTCCDGDPPWEGECCAGSPPAEVSVVLAGISGSPSCVCSDLNDTYIITLNGVTCISTVQKFHDCGGDSQLVRVEIVLGEFAIHVTVCWLKQNGEWIKLRWVKNFGSSVNCQSLSNEEIPFVGWGIPGDCSLGFTQFPAPPDECIAGTCHVTALP